jgi:hypothetical protein
VVLDDQNRQVEVLPQTLDQRAELSYFLVVQASGGLVEKQQARSGDERAGELDPLQRPEGQAGGRAVLQVREAEVVGKSTMFWKVRATPVRTTLYGLVLSRSRPSKSTRPVSGR